MSDDGRPLVVVKMCKLVAHKVEGDIFQVSMVLDRRVSIDDWRIDDFQIDIFRSMISRSTIDEFKKNGRIG